ncbi:hypothetical protein F3Y22_tig00112281pilonHSYRG00164 [Hibiscus syriacus]|uniref:Uncharacterized protein n=1 Tax=Hibiscus syriacus TaxID=106335 RepID=A0A6A2XPT8_HIBSY|nr:hypothetical protein F3Y22_tig00112281pilonHSYRG00164 [Hibiscus syriacus]
MCVVDMLAGNCWNEDVEGCHRCWNCNVQSLQGDTGSYLINWNSSDPIHVHGMVFHVETRKFMLLSFRTSDYPVICLLHSLELSGNSLYGPLPTESREPQEPTNLGSFTEFLQWHGTFIYSSMQKVNCIFLSQNCFIGSLPEELGNSLVGLQKLNLSYKQLQRLDPGDIRNLSNFSVLSIYLTISSLVVKEVIRAQVGWLKTCICDGGRSASLDSCSLIVQEGLRLQRRHSIRKHGAVQPVPLDTEVDFDLEQLLKASAFVNLRACCFR